MRIMKTTKSLLLLLASAIVLAGLSGCEKDNDSTANPGGQIVLGVKSLNSDDGTRAAYAVPAGGTKDLKINWKNDDLVKIVCAEANESQSAVYKTTGATAQGNANLTVNTGSTALCWSEDDPDENTYNLFAAFPSTGTLTTAGSLTASVASAQGNAGISADSNGNWTVAPDMTNMTLVSKLSTGRTDNALSFQFTPLSTAIQFEITNDRGATMNVKSISLVSAVTGQNLAGTYTTDLSDTWAAPTAPSNAWAGSTYSYAKTYPACTNLTSGSETVTIATPASTTQDYIAVADGKKLTATFFLQPTAHLYDLKFKITFSDDSVLALLIKRTDQSSEAANRVYFPRHAKSYVKGIMVPDAAYWEITFNNTVASWGTPINSNINLY